MTFGILVQTLSYMVVELAHCRSLHIFENCFAQIRLFQSTYTCAFKPGCLMSHNWLHTPDCKVSNENDSDSDSDSDSDADADADF